MQPHVEAVPCLKDNYCYLVMNPSQDELAVVDPSEAEPVSVAVERLGKKIGAILLTHHHWDHVGGVDALVATSGAPVFAHISEAVRIPQLSRPLEDGQSFDAAGLRFRAWHIPAHTRGALAFVTGTHCFVGDTLFAAGAGRLFEGTPHDLYHALYEVLGRMPLATIFHTGHEYTEKNLEFAQRLEPRNQAIAERLLSTRAQRARCESTASTTLALERETNPFLRVNVPDVVHGLGLDPDTNPTTVLGKLRELKDNS